MVGWFLPSAHSATFEFSVLAHILQMLLASKINAHISSNFCPDLQDGRWILKALNANWYWILQVFRLSHVVLAIIGKSTFWYLQKLLEILHLKIQKSCTKAKLKTKLKVKKGLYCDSLKTTGFIRVKLWKLFKECHFFPQENGCFAQNNYFLWKEYVMGHKSFLKW